MKRPLWTSSVCLGVQLLCFAPEAVAMVKTEGGTWFGPSWCAESGARLGTGDFNEDNWADLFCTDASGTTNIALSTGTEGFAAPSQWLTAWCADTPSNPTRVGAGDFDGDGDDDLYCNDVYGTTWVAPSNGAAGGFGSTSIWRSGWCPVNANTRIGTGDFNGDGESDLYCNDNLGNTSVALSNGISAFGTPTTWQEAWCYNNGTTRFGTGDFDADGDSDIYCNGTYGGVFVGLSNGVNDIAALQTWHANFCPSSASNRIGASDLDGDGRWDAYCTTTTSAGGTQAVLSNGSSMGEAGDWFDGNWCSRKPDSALLSADFDGLGRGDLYCHSTTQPPSTAIQAAIYGQTPPTATNISTCPYLFDAERWVRVYQIGGGGIGDNFTLPYHQSPFIDNNWVVIRNHANNFSLYKKVNVRTCEEEELTARGAATGAFLRGSQMWAFRYVLHNNTGPVCNTAGQAWLSKADLSQNPPVWTDYVCLPDNAPNEPYPSGEVAVSSNGVWIVWAQVSDTSDTPDRTRVWAYRVSDGAKKELTANSGEIIQHIAFSPGAADARVFTYYNQDGAFRKELPDYPNLRIMRRVGIGKAGTGSDAGMNIFALDPPPGGPEGYWTDNHQAAHAFWMPDGNLSVDILENPSNPWDIYDLASLAIAGSSQPWIVPGSAQTNRRYIPGDHWNTHFTRTTKPDWFVGDGDHLNSYPSSAFTQVGQLLPWGVRFDRLARNWGAKDRDNGHAHMLPTRDGVLVTLRISEASLRHVYLIELPQAIRDRIQ